MRSWLMSMLVLAGVQAVGGGQDFFEDLESGVGAARSYHKAPDELKIEWSNTQAASGQRYARAPSCLGRSLWRDSP